jgi:hypothetical protein
MKQQTYPLDDNPALIHLVKCRREDGQSWDDLQDGDVSPALKQLSPEDRDRLRELTTPAS